MYNFINDTTQLNQLCLSSSSALKHYTYAHTINSVCIYNNLIISAQNNQIYISDINTFELIDKLDGHLNIIYSVCIKNNNIISCSADKTIRIWNINTYECVKILRGHTSSIYCICPSANQDNLVISGSLDKTVRIWDITTGECHKILTGHYGSIVSICVSNNLVISASHDSTIRIWDIKNGKCLTILHGHISNVLNICIHNNLIISCSSDMNICIWNINDVLHQTCTNSNLHLYSNLRTNAKTNAKTLYGHTGTINSVASINENLILSCSNDRTMRIWDVETYECIRIFKCYDTIYDDYCITSVCINNNLIISESIEGSIRITNIIIYPHEYNIFNTIIINYGIYPSLCSEIWSYFAEINN